jgi:dUTPase
MIKKLFYRLLFGGECVIEYFSTHPILFNGRFPQLCLGSEDRIGVRAGESKTLVLGVYLHVPKGVVVMVLLKPGLCTSRGLTQDFPEVLPPDYRGNVRIRVTNHSVRDSFFNPNSDIAFLVPLCRYPVRYVCKPLKEVDANGFNQLPEY